MCQAGEALSQILALNFFNSNPGVSVDLNSDCILESTGEFSNQLGPTS